MENKVPNSLLVLIALLAGCERVNNSTLPVFRDSEEFSADTLAPAVSAQQTSAPEDLNELSARKTRYPSAAWGPSLMENAAERFSWQPETLVYTDLTANNEVWQFTTPAVRNNTQDISITHWSANGHRVLFHSKRVSNAFPYANGTNSIWMLSNSDGSNLRPAKGAAAQLPSVDAYVLWSPVLADTLYQSGANDGQGLLMNGLYKVQVSDASIGRSLLFSVPGATRLQLKKAISGDGRKVIIKDPNNAKLFPATIEPAASARLDLPYGYSMLLNFDYWASPITSWVGYHDQFLTGAANGIDQIWHYIMPENANGSWWRTRLTGSRADGAPLMSEDLAPPYNWGGELEPINSGGGGRNPWCPQGAVPGTDCMEYFSHFAPDRWGHYGISTKSGLFPFGTSIADLRNHSYKVIAFTPLKVNEEEARWVQHHDWEAWSDWSVSSAYPNTGNYVRGAIVTQNVKDISSQRMLASAYTRLNGTASPPYESLARPIQSPDGTKIMYNSTLLSHSDSKIQLFWTVAYYPHPPQIKTAEKAAGHVRLSWDYNQGTGCSADSAAYPRTGPAPNFLSPRTYATRGWPHETLDCAPSPREIKQFRVWISEDKAHWSPIGTTAYGNCAGMNECGMWAESSWTLAHAQPVSATRYYAVTSLEHSGLESRTLSNIWKVMTDSSGEITFQAEDSAYPSSPGGKSGFYTSAPAAPSGFSALHIAGTHQYRLSWFEPADASLIRYYNIYAQDGETPDAIQQHRIASVPKGTTSYLDWAGSNAGITKYAVTSVDYQGNESPTVRY